MKAVVLKQHGAIEPIDDPIQGHNRQCAAGRDHQGDVDPDQLVRDHQGGDQG